MATEKKSKEMALIWLHYLATKKKEAKHAVGLLRTYDIYHNNNKRINSGSVSAAMQKKTR